MEAVLVKVKANFEITNVRMKKLCWSLYQLHWKMCYPVVGIRYGYKNLVSITIANKCYLSFSSSYMLSLLKNRILSFGWRLNLEWRFIDKFLIALFLDFTCSLMALRVMVLWQTKFWMVEHTHILLLTFALSKICRAKCNSWSPEICYSNSLHALPYVNQRPQT